MLRISPESSRTVLLISGMRDEHSRERVAAAIERVEGVEAVSVNLFRATATVTYSRPCQVTHLVHAVDGAGYKGKFIP
jgi:copper chaperone CopZ